MQVYIGCSEAQTFDEIHAKLDLNYEPDPDNPTSYFEREFGAGYIDPGSYEIYDRADFEGEEFSQDFVKTLFPFAPPTDLNLWSRDFAKLRSVFFVISDKVWTATESGGIEITDSIAKPKFEFEE